MNLFSIIIMYPSEIVRKILFIYWKDEWYINSINRDGLYTDDKYFRSRRDIQKLIKGMNFYTIRDEMKKQHKCEATIFSNMFMLLD